VPRPVTAAFAASRSTSRIPSAARAERQVRRLPTIRRHHQLPGGKSGQRRSRYPAATRGHNGCVRGGTRPLRTRPSAANSASPATSTMTRAHGTRFHRDAVDDDQDALRLRLRRISLPRGTLSRPRSGRSRRRRRERQVQAGRPGTSSRADRRIKVFLLARPCSAAGGVTTNSIRPASSPARRWGICSCGPCCRRVVVALHWMAEGPSRTPAW
jgi:hypothetical protein